MAGNDKHTSEPDWPSRLEALLGKVPDAEIAQELGVSPRSVAARRRKMGIKSELAHTHTPAVKWKKRWDKLLGTMRDTELAEKLEVSRHQIRVRRLELRIPPYEPAALPEPSSQTRPPVTLTAAQIRKLGCVPDAVLAERWNISAGVIRRHRIAHGIEPYQAGGEVDWTTGMLVLLGEVSDNLIAREYGISSLSVKIKRIQLGIFPHGKDQMDPEPDLPRRVLSQIGKVPDKQIADKFRVSRTHLRIYRVLHNIPQADYQPSPEHKWTAAETALFGTMRDSDLARKLQIPIQQIAHRRRMLGIPAFGRNTKIVWGKKQLKRLGQQPDRVLAFEWGWPQGVVRKKRDELGITACPSAGRIWIQEELEQLGTTLDTELAKKLGVSPSAVSNKRREWGIPPLKRTSRFEWKKEDLAKLGKVPDHELALELGLSYQYVGSKRSSLGIRAYCPGDERWTPEIIEKMGVMSDARIAKELGVSPSLVSAKRRELGIPTIYNVKRDI